MPRRPLEYALSWGPAKSTSWWLADLKDCRDGSLVVVRIFRVVCVGQCMLETIMKYPSLGGLIGGIALLCSAVVAGVTLVFFNLRSRQDLVYRDLSGLYKRFWESDEFAKVRRWIDSDSEFSKIRLAIDVVTGPTLMRPLTDKEAADIESIDRFCAILMEAFFLREIGASRSRRKLVDAMFLDHWVRKLDSRPELRGYIADYWPRLYNHMKKRRAYFKTLDRLENLAGMRRW